MISDRDDQQEDRYDPLHRVDGRDVSVASTINHAILLAYYVLLHHCTSLLWYDVCHYIVILMYITGFQTGSGQTGILQKCRNIPQL